MHEEYASLMTGLPLFKGYTAAGAQRLISKGTVEEHPPDEVLFKEGDAAEEVLLVLKGKLQVYVERQGHQLVLTDCGPGTILGELAVLCGIQRSASVRVLESSTVLRWDANAFRSLLLADAFLSERIFRQALRTLIDKEQSLIASLTQSQSGTTASESNA
jgi:CRP-like cAMP-binding protein